MILGRTGRNFAAGMSGGLAYVLDHDRAFARRCNHDAIDLEPLIEDDDIEIVRGLLERHVRYTGSAVAAPAARGLGGEQSSGSSRWFRATTSARWRPGRRVQVAGVAVCRCCRSPMGKASGFLEVRREKQPARPVLSGPGLGGGLPALQP